MRRRPLPVRAVVRQENMIRGVAENKFIQQRRRRRPGQLGHEARRRPHEIRLYRRKARLLRPVQHVGRHRVPRVVDVAERRAQIVADVVIDAHQFFAPARRRRGVALKRRIPAIRRVRVRHVHQQKRRVRIHRHRIPGESRAAVRHRARPGNRRAIIERPERIRAQIRENSVALVVRRHVLQDTTSDFSPAATLPRKRRTSSIGPYCSDSE